MSNESIFKNKILSICIDSDDCSHDLINPYFEEINGRKFLVGEVTNQSTESGWVAGKKSAIAWEKVYEYFIFDTLKEYVESTKISTEFYKKKEKDD